MFRGLKFSFHYSLYLQTQYNLIYVLCLTISQLKLVFHDYFFMLILKVIFIKSWILSCKYINYKSFV
jgi:hypothetical protein